MDQLVPLKGIDLVRDVIIAVMGRPSSLHLCSNVGAAYDSSLSDAGTVILNSGGGCTALLGSLGLHDQYWANAL